MGSKSVEIILLEALSHACKAIIKHQIYYDITCSSGRYSMEQDRLETTKIRGPTIPKSRIDLYYSDLNNSIK